MIILQLLGGLLLVALAVVGMAYLYYKIKYGKYYNSDTSLEPLIIHLIEDVSPDWLENKKVRTIVKELECLGFCSGKAYSIYEIGEVSLQVFFKGSIVSVLYSHEIAGIWVDMLVEEVNGKEYTFSNVPSGSGIESRPECSKFTDSRASCKTLYEGINKIVENSETDYSNINGNNFREYFEFSCKRDMTWQNRNGGLSYESFLTIEKEMPFRSNEKTIKNAFIIRKEAELHQWNDAAIEEYSRSEGINEEDFYDIEYKLFIVPYTTNATAFLRYLESKNVLNEDQSKKLEKLYSNETDMYEIFEEINNLFSPELRAKYVKKIEFPLDLKIFRLSKIMSY